MIRLLNFFVICVVCYTSIAAKEFVHPRIRNTYFQLSIAHINDVHARFVQTSQTFGSCPKGKESKCVGGLGRILTASRQLLKEQPNVIFFNTADNYQGTIWHTIYHWNASVHFLNKLPLHVTTIGNHDFDDGISGLIPFLQRVNVPVVVTNIDDSQEPTIQGYYKNSTVFTRGDRKIGIIGVITKSTPIFSKTGKLKFLDEIESVNAEAARLKSQGIDIIIVLSHCGLDVDRLMAAKCPDIDVIVGGHSHTFLYTGKAPSNDKPEDDYPVVVKQNKTDRTVLIVQAAAYTKYLGNLTVWFDSKGEVVDWEGNPILLDNKIQEDPEMISELKLWEGAVNTIGLVHVGETKTLLNNSCYSGECNMANLITDAMVYAFKNKSDSPQHWTYAAISVMNTGGIRNSIPAGNITYGDLVSVQPFENTFDVVDLQGVDLYHALEESVSLSYSENYFQGKKFFHWSGIRVVYNLSQPAYSRIVDVQVRCQECLEPKFEDLQKDKTYRVVVASYIVSQGPDANTIAKKHKNRRLGELDISQIVDYVKAISPFEYKLDKRVVLLGKCCG